MERPSLCALLLGTAGILLLPLSSSSSSNHKLGCGDCMLDYCPALPPGGCQLGETRDECGCCPLCARDEGEPCGDLPLVGMRYCAHGMECVKSRKRSMDKAWSAAASSRRMSGVCVCKTRHPVCGSDGTTYPNACQLRAANLKAEFLGKQPITQVSKGPCERSEYQRLQTRGLIRWGTQLVATAFLDLDGREA